VGKKVVQLTITPDANSILQASTAERKRGEWVSAAIVAYARPAQPTGVIEQLAAQLAELTAKVDKLLHQGSVTEGQ